MIRIEAAGGVLYRPDSNSPLVLLIYRNGVWDLPKGKREKSETWQECAEREVSEEVGVRHPRTVAHLTDTYHEYRQNSTYYGKTTRWYSMKFNGDPDEMTPQEEEGIEKLEWVPLAEAKQRVGYRNLVEVLELFEASLK